MLFISLSQITYSEEMQYTNFYLHFSSHEIINSNAAAYQTFLECRDNNCTLKFKVFNECTPTGDNPKDKVMTVDTDTFSTLDNTLNLSKKANNQYLVSFKYTDFPYHKVFNFLIITDDPYPNDTSLNVKSIDASVVYKSYLGIDKEVRKLRLVKREKLKRSCQIYLH